MKKRLKIEEIFTHPWVIGFEAEQEKKNKLLEDAKKEETKQFFSSAGPGFFKKAKAQAAKENTTSFDGTDLTQNLISEEKFKSSKDLKEVGELKNLKFENVTMISPKKSLLNVRNGLGDKFIADLLDLG